MLLHEGEAVHTCRDIREPFTAVMAEPAMPRHWELMSAGGTTAVRRNATFTNVSSAFGSSLMAAPWSRVKSLNVVSARMHCPLMVVLLLHVQAKS